MMIIVINELDHLCAGDRQRGPMKAQVCALPESHRRVGYGVELDMPGLRCRMTAAQARHLARRLNSLSDTADAIAREMTRIQEAKDGHPRNGACCAPAQAAPVG